MVAEGIEVPFESITRIFEIEKSVAVTVVPDAMTQFRIRKFPVPKPLVLGPANFIVLLVEL